ncbi:hypothetical protein H1R17_04965 [Flavobacterium sp. xlx-214]|uniref:hypothetical protein n=1 Tax=unclassified Flavobacterium TaxID=196869 RepID=UPI0013CFDA12|nr:MULTISPECIES: hypothetical protein [unclassified Flavobacterium]MBA5793552.1 hypothetical protein [Flavobacterium sp. xlx-221]QMI84482.1 hypothetical protein H1R17_04965 [Flavobacterium sp. xlx-214]
MNNLVNYYFYLLFLISITVNAQNSTYTQKAEYGYKGAVKKVTSYIVDATKYTIPTDTVAFTGKTIMTFTKNGDVINYLRRYNQPKYNYKSKAVFKGIGKNISYKEEYTLNDAPAEKKEYQFIWTNPLEYKIVVNKDSLNQVRTITLNNDFSIHKVTFKGLNYFSEEQATYQYANNLLEKITYKVTITNNEETNTKEDIRLIKAVDVYNNPTVIYFFEKESSRVPKSVVFKYYEYY